MHVYIGLGLQTALPNPPIPPFGRKQMSQAAKPGLVHLSKAGISDLGDHHILALSLQEIPTLLGFARHLLY